MRGFLRHAPALAAGAAALMLALVGAAPGAAAATKLDFVTHAAFFSQETRQAKPLDPQVFVRDPAAAAGVGPQGIHHAAGLRPALIEDAASTPLFTADGKSLDFTLGQWLGARGAVTLSARPSGGTGVKADFTGLRPGGVYSLFENHFDQQPIGFTPLDGDGTRNSFVAKDDGTASLSVDAPGRLTSANAVLLVYHSDGRTHGAARGEIGVTAHHQLIAKLP